MTNCIFNNIFRGTSEVLHRTTTASFVKQFTFVMALSSLWHGFGERHENVYKVMKRCFGFGLAH